MNNDKQLLQRQLTREVQQHELGLERFKHQLEKRKLGMDYSNSTGGRFIQKNLMEQMTEAVEAMVEKCSKGIGRNHGEVTEAIKRVSNLPVIDLQTGEHVEDKFTTPWRHDQAALITFRTMLDVSVMPTRAITQGFRSCDL